MLGVFCFAFLLGAPVTPAMAMHGGNPAWIERYTGLGGVSCCGVRDCPPIPVSVIGKQGNMIHVRIGGRVNQTLWLRQEKVHLSQDAHTYVCGSCKDGITSQEGANTPPPALGACIRCVFVHLPEGNM